MKKLVVYIIISILVGASAQGGWFWESADDETVSGNHHSQSLYAVKREIADKVYYDHRETLYCGAKYDKFKQIAPLKGFKMPDINKVDFKVYDITEQDLQKRAKRMEWEHIVPAENFGRTFREWSVGHKNCVSRKGKTFKGRSCAEQESEEFRYMYADMYNLYPSIGAVNFLRANFNFTQFNEHDNVPYLFGCCKMKISHNRAEPRDEVKGLIARTYFYMEQTYPRYKIGEPMRGILQAWDKKYPLNKWECQRAFRIEKVQGNPNEVIKSACVAKGWYKK